MPRLPGTFDDLKRDIELLATHLPLKLGDRTLLVLKGHLLTEHLLTQFIRSKAPAPEHVDSEAFRFPQHIALARMLAPKGNNEWVWSALKKLNSLRNTLAHRLDSTDSENKLDAFLKSVPPNDAIQAFGPLGNALVALYFGLADHLRFKTQTEILVDALRNWEPSNKSIEPTRER
jgi:hypothetical protein